MALIGRIMVVREERAATIMDEPLRNTLLGCVRDLRTRLDDLEAWIRCPSRNDDPSIEDFSLPQLDRIVEALRTFERPATVSEVQVLTGIRAGSIRQVLYARPDLFLNESPPRRLARWSLRPAARGEFIRREIHVATTVGAG